MTIKETENWIFHHVGVVVADMEKAIKYYKSLGIVDFSSDRTREDTHSIWVEMTSYGKTIIKDGQVLFHGNTRVETIPVQFCRLGSLTLELTETGGGVFENVHYNFLKNCGEGINHIAYRVDGEHFEEEVEKMKLKGLEIVMSGRKANGGGFFYFDTSKIGGIITELMWYPT